MAALALGANFGEISVVRRWGRSGRWADVHVLPRVPGLGRPLMSLRTFNAMPRECQVERRGLGVRVRLQ